MLAFRSGNVFWKSDWDWNRYVGTVAVPICGFTGKPYGI